MSDETLDLEAIQARADAATDGAWDDAEMRRWPGRWDVWDREGRKCIAEVLWEADAEFIAHARADVPALVAAVGLLRTQRDEASAERDAYKRAKAENDDRFMIERDQARAERDALQARVDAVLAQCVWAESIGTYIEIGDWANGPFESDGMEMLSTHQVRAALAAAVPVQPAERCGRCGHAPHEKPCLNMASDNDCSCPSSPAVQPVNDETDEPNIGPWDGEARCARRRCSHPQSWHGAAHATGPCDEDTCPCGSFMDPLAHGEASSSPAVLPSVPAVTDEQR